MLIEFDSARRSARQKTSGLDMIELKITLPRFLLDWARPFKIDFSKVCAEAIAKEIAVRRDNMAREESSERLNDF